jgi:aromatic-L-amino-acid decarboxylase
MRPHRRRALDPEQFRRFGHQVGWIADYRARATQHPATSRVEPGSIRAKLPSSPPAEPEGFQRFSANR